MKRGRENLDIPLKEKHLGESITAPLFDGTVIQNRFSCFQFKGLAPEKFDGSENKRCSAADRSGNAIAGSCRSHNR
jgi:hypothetical protein